MNQEEELFGLMEAKRGDRCTNAHTERRFTTPCCYTDMDGKADQCPTCGAPIECFVEMVPEAVCRIADEDDEEDDEEEEE